MEIKMGLLAVGISAATSVLQDQWRDYFYCESLPVDILVAKGSRRESRHSRNMGDDNIISNGSIIAVNEGQCMMIVEQGAIVELCAQPGEFVYNASTEPSVFYGGLGNGIVESFNTFKKRFAFGGNTAKDQRVYYFNTKEIIGNKYGTASPIPFRVIDKNIGLDVDISIACHGEYSYKIADPVLFYRNVCGNVGDVFNRDIIAMQLRSEMLTALQPAFARISAQGIRYSELPGHTNELTQALDAELDEKWGKARGIQLESIGISGLTAPDEDIAMIKNLQKSAVYRNPTMAAAGLASAQADAMRDAANNSNGAMMGFAGMGFAQQAGGMNVQQLYQMGQAQNNQNQQMKSVNQNVWKCPTCGQENTGNFCSNCGTRRPTVSNKWVCPHCGRENTGNFCDNCGTKKPDNF
jgi:membrane protease subunit (stomatin/prohibitin family)